MSIRSSSVSLKGLLSKFNSASSNANTYQAASEDYAYSQGQMTPQDYLAILNKRLKSTANGTTANLTVQKKINSTKLDIESNDLEAKIARGEADPKEMLPVISRIMAENNVVEGSPKYNELYNKAVSLNDQSIDRQIQQAKRKWTQDSEQDQTGADDNYINTVAGLIENYSNQLKYSTAWDSLVSFSQDAQKRSIDSEISSLRQNLVESGQYGTLSGKRALANGLYSMYQKLNEAGLYEKADDIYGQYLSAADSLSNAISSASSKEQTSLVSSLKSDLRMIPLTDKDTYAKTFNELLVAMKGQADNYFSSGKEDSASKIYDDLALMGYDFNTNKFNPAIVQEMLANGITPSDQANQMLHRENLYTGEGDPKIGQYIAVNKDGKLTFETITDTQPIGTTADGRTQYDVRFDGDRDAQNGNRENYVQDADGILYNIHGQSGSDNRKMFFIQGKNENGEETTKYVGYDNNGNATILGDKEFATGNNKNVIFRQQADNGGWNFFEYNPSDGKYTAIDAQSVQNNTGLAIDKILEGSKNQSDIDAINNFKNLNPKDVINSQVSPLIKLLDKSAGKAEAKTPEQIEQEKLQKSKAEALKPVVTEINNELEKASQPANLASSPTPAPVSAAPTPKQIAETNSRPVYRSAANPVAAASTGGLGKMADANYQDLGAGVYKERSSDGGWNFFAKDMKGKGLPIDIATAAKYTGKAEKDLVQGSNSAYDKNKYGI